MSKVGYVINTDAFYQTEPGVWLPDLEDGRNLEGLWSEDLNNAYIYRTKQDAQSEIDKAEKLRKISSPDYEVVEVEMQGKDRYGAQASEEPEENDAFLTPSGNLGSKVSVSIDEEFLGEFTSEEKAEEALKDYMEKNQYWPNIWWVDDHGGISKYTLEANVKEDLKNSLRSLGVKLEGNKVQVASFEKVFKTRIQANNRFRQYAQDLSNAAERAENLNNLTELVKDELASIAEDFDIDASKLETEILEHLQNALRDVFGVEQRLESATGREEE